MRCIYNSYMISKRLKELIQEENIKIKVLVERLNITNPTKIYDWLNGRNQPNLVNLVKLADYFHCSIEYLIGRTDDNSVTEFKVCPPFDERLRAVMKERNVTQYRLILDKIVNPSHFTRWMKEKYNPELSSLIKLADYLNVSIDYLIGRE